MEGQAVQYQGKLVSKDHFRVFVYGKDNAKKLVESHDEYEKALESGLWFSNKEDVPRHYEETENVLKEEAEKVNKKKGK